jgi:hypothetical protein
MTLMKSMTSLHQGQRIIIFEDLFFGPYNILVIEKSYAIGSNVY